MGGPRQAAAPRRLRTRRPQIKSLRTFKKFSYTAEIQELEDELYRRSRELTKQRNALGPAEYARLHEQWGVDFESYEKRYEEVQQTIAGQTGELTPAEQTWRDWELQRLRAIFSTQPGDFYPKG